MWAENGCTAARRDREASKLPVLSIYKIKSRRKISNKYELVDSGFKKLIVLPECNNINKIIKSEITIIPKSNLSKTLIILICTIKMDLQNYIIQFICLQEC